MRPLILEQGSEAMLALEYIVDRVGIRNVVDALASIAREKAKHLRVNWQDNGAVPRLWEGNARRLERCAQGLTRVYGETQQ
jgi:hypothetical protein